MAKLLFGCALLAFILWLLTGCALRPNNKSGSNVTESQLPGEASGAGATLVGPTNAAQQTTQTAKRRTRYFAPARQWPLPSTGLTEQAIAAVATPAPDWIDEQVTTVLSPHQDAAAIVKVAEEANKWSKTRWIGICLVIGAIIFALYYRGTDGGYPLVYAKVICIGAVIAIVDPSPWWLCLLILPSLFYVAQKLKLINLPVFL